MYICEGLYFNKNDVRHVICEGLYFIRTMFAMLYMWGFVFYKNDVRPMFAMLYVRVCVRVCFHKNDVRHVICEGLYFIRTMFAM